MKITAPLLRGGGELHVIGSSEVLTLADPDGAIHRLVELADGTRSTSELFCLLLPQYPGLDQQDVLDAIGILESAGFVEDCLARRRLLGERDRAPVAMYA
jgi:hypothetical protein